MRKLCAINTTALLMMMMIMACMSQSPSKTYTALQNLLNLYERKPLPSSADTQTHVYSLKEEIITHITYTIKITYNLDSYRCVRIVVASGIARMCIVWPGHCGTQVATEDCGPLQPLDGVPSSWTQDLVRVRLPLPHMLLHDVHGLHSAHLPPVTWCEKTLGINS